MEKREAPLIILDEIYEYINNPHPFCGEIQINLFFNEFKERKYKILVVILMLSSYQ